MKPFEQFLKQWNADNNSFGKLQYAYVAIAVTSFLVAGVIGLMNHRLGQSILFIAMCATLVFVSNGIVWALLRTFVISRVEQKKTPTTTRKK